MKTILDVHRSAEQIAVDAALVSAGGCLARHGFPVRYLGPDCDAVKSVLAQWAQIDGRQMQLPLTDLAA